MTESFRLNYYLMKFLRSIENKSCIIGLIHMFVHIHILHDTNYQFGYV